MYANSPARSIEMNVIIIAACIPTLRPIFLVLFKQSGSENFRASVRERGHSSYYYRTADSDGSKHTTTGSSATTKAFDQGASRAMTGSTEAINNKTSVDNRDLIRVESREIGSRDGETGEEEWCHANGSGIPMTDILGGPESGYRDPGRMGREGEV